MKERVLTKNIKEYCQEEKDKIKKYIKENFKKAPSIAVIQVGNNEASNRYIKNKKKDCEEVGIDFQWYGYEEEITTKDLIIEIQDLLPYVDGMLIQMPLPDHIDETAIKEIIPPDKDLDGFHPMSLFKPCTPLGIINYLEKGCNFDLSGKNVVVIGRSDIVGKPLAKMLTDKDATVTLCHSKTKDKWNFIDKADLVICAVGKAKFLNCYSIHAPIIDVGINFDENGKLVGDCFNIDHADVTPVPGGVGLLTRLALLENAVSAAKMQRQGQF